jgi:site-specific DNA-methyltransferase (adenine-specific)
MTAINNKSASKISAKKKVARKRHRSGNKKAVYEIKASPRDFYVAEKQAKYGDLPYKEYFKDQEHNITLLKGDSIATLNQARPESVDMIFADPPYFLSNGGITCHAGKMVSVNKGKWDKSIGVEESHEFTQEWLKACQRVLKPNGTIWVSGTTHIIYSVGFAMQKLGYKILNDIIWYKRNAPPNLSCRYFTHSTEVVLWAAKNKKSRHFFDYPLMKEINAGKQMRNLWELSAPAKSEKKYGKHPTQKPLGLLERILLSSTQEGNIVLDPFCGSSTTGVEAVLLNRKYYGIDLEDQYLELSKKRLLDAIREKHHA